MSQLEQQTDSPHSSPSPRRRLLWAALVLTGLLVTFWGAGGLAAILHHRVSAALAVRNYEAAEDLLAWVRRLRCANAATDFWEARLRRKQLRVSDVPDLLSLAARGGFDPERLRREALLLEAQTGGIEPIVNELHEMMIEPGPDGAEVCEAYVNGALIAGASELALRVLPVWKQDFPEDPQANYAHARLLEYREQPDAAEAELRLAIRKDPNHWPSRYAFGRIMLEQNRVEAALQQFDAAVRMRDNAAPLYQRARCLRALSRPDEALAILKELVRRSNDDIGRSFSRVGEPPLGMPIQLELGTLESSLKNYEAALRWIDTALQDSPRDLDARYARAVALRGLNRSEEANREFAAVQHERTQLEEVDRLVDEINRSPQDLHLEQRFRIGELFLRHGSGRRGEFWLQEVLHRDPSHLPAHTLLAEYYADLAQRNPKYAPLAEKHRKAAGQPAPRTPGQVPSQNAGSQP